MESQIYHAQVALEHYRKAYAHELSVSNPEAPDSPGSKPEGENGNPKNSKSGNKKKNGPAAIATRARLKARVSGSLAVFPGIRGTLARIYPNPPN